MGLFNIFGGKSNEFCKAISNGAIKAVTKMINEGIDVNKKGDDGRDGYKKSETPLNYAIKNGNIEIIKLLLDFGADLEEGCPLYIASFIGNYEATELLLNRGASVDQQYDTYDGSGRNRNHLKTPLDVAATHGYESIVKLLLNNKADVNGLQSNIMRTPLAQTLLYCRSAYDGNPEPISKLLLSFGASINLHLAAGLGDLQEIQNFINKGSDINGIEDGSTPLDLAIDANKLEAVKLLVKNGAIFSNKQKSAVLPTPIQIVRNRKWKDMATFLETLR